MKTKNKISAQRTSCLDLPSGTMGQGTVPLLTISSSLSEAYGC